MPKENVNDIVTPELRAEVSWRPDTGDGTGYVQLATVHTNSPATIPAEQDATTSSGGQVTMAPVDLAGRTWTEASGGQQPEMRQALDGWHVTLDREHLNRLIRMLRRARDAAFGPDA